MKVRYERLYKDAIFLNKRKKLRRLQGNGANINDDFSLPTLEKRKGLLQTARTLRDQGKGAKVIKDRLITWEWRKRDENINNGEKY